MTGEALKFSRLRSTGRLLVEAIGSLGTAPANSYKRWANAWRLVLAGQDTPQSRAVLAAEAQRLKKYLESLPEAERYEAAMALHTRVPRSLPDDPLLAKLAKETSILLEPGLEKLVGEAARALHHEVGQLTASLAKGTLSAEGKATLKHLQALKALTGDGYDGAIEEVARESVRQLKTTAASPLKRIGSKVNPRSRGRSHRPASSAPSSSGTPSAPSCARRSPWSRSCSARDGRPRRSPRAASSWRPRPRAAS